MALRIMLLMETVQSSSVFKSFRIVYNVQCECENDQMKVSRAINLAHDKHCGGVQMLRKIAPVADEIAIVNTK
jgi:putative redox protein